MTRIDGIYRKGFCLACGKEHKQVFVPYVHGRLPAAASGDGPVPTWCKSPECLKAHAGFQYVAERIVYGNPHNKE